MYEPGTLIGDVIHQIWVIQDQIRNSVRNKYKTPHYEGITKVEAEVILPDEGEGEQVHRLVWQDDQFKKVEDCQSEDGTEKSKIKMYHLHRLKLKKRLFDHKRVVVGGSPVKDDQGYSTI